MYQTRFDFEATPARIYDDRLALVKRATPWASTFRKSKKKAARMPKCFVIQPFDGSTYDKRYRDTFKPAIEAAGLQPYRVDEDHGVEIPIEDIERGIAEAPICFAEISEDKPNVWYELGFARALGKPVCMVRSKTKPKLPFDVQHRTIILYDEGSVSDFKELETKITKRLQALMEKHKSGHGATPIASARRSKLQIIYDPAYHRLQETSGEVKIRLSIKNVGDAKAKRIRLKIESLVPKTNVEVAHKYSGQFTAMWLQTTHSNRGFNLNPGESEEVQRLISAERNGEWFLSDGYHPDGSRQTFRTPAADYILTVSAADHDGGGDRRQYLVGPREGGVLQFTEIH